MLIFPKAPLVDRVKAGAAWLDIKVPDWASRVDTATLSMVSSEHCVAGQVFREEAERTGMIHGYSYLVHTYTDDYVIPAALMGFALVYPLDPGDDQDDDDAWFRLRDLWIEEINARRTEEA